MSKILAYSYKDIWKVSLPIMLGLLAQNIVQLTATFFLGKVGEVEQSASGLAGVYYIACFIICFGFSIGGQIMISRRNGEKNYNRIGEIVVQGALFLLALALVLFMLSGFLSKNLLPQFMKSPEVYQAVDTYLSWRIYGFFFASINVMFRAFYVGIARTPVLTINAIVMGIINFLGDYTLIFGHWGMPQLGIAGAGIAAVVSEMFSVLFFMIYTLITVDLKKYGFNKMHFRFGIVRSILSISSFTMVQYLISMSTWFIFFIAIEQQSTQALAITNIVRNLYMLFFIPVNAFATTTNTLVGNTIGSGATKDVIPLVKRICLVNLLVMVVIMIITLINPQYWISLIAPHDDPTLISKTVAPLLVILFGLPMTSISSVVFNSISGTGNTRAALILESSTLVLYMLYIYWIVIYKQASVAVCWTVEYVYWGFLLLFSVLYFKYAHWQNKTI